MSRALVVVVYVLKIVTANLVEIKQWKVNSVAFSLFNRLEILWLFYYVFLYRPVFLTRLRQIQ